MLILQGVSHSHPNGDVLFDNINLCIHKNDKAALVGNNGSGKTTMLKMMAGLIRPRSGIVVAEQKPYYLPQITGQFNHLTIAGALGVDKKLRALQEILDGKTSEANMTTLDDDWLIAEKCQAALSRWNLNKTDLDAGMATLSGGQKTKVFLAGISIHKPEIVLMDEPSNHLDQEARKLLYHYINDSAATIVIVSHDRTLLNLLQPVYELNNKGVQLYGGNYDFYVSQKDTERNALNQSLREKEKSLRKAKETERETLERQQKSDARGRKKQSAAGMPVIVMNTMRNSAEKSTAKTKDIHAAKISNIHNELSSLRDEIPDKDKMKIGFDRPGLHNGKPLIKAEGVNHSFGEGMLWESPLDFTISSGERLSLSGGNGSGKTTLVKFILGQLRPCTGTIEKAAFKAIYIDQDYSLISNAATVLEMALSYNANGLEIHEVKSKLTHFLFTKTDWDKSCCNLSGGEKMRLILCCLTISNRAPDMIVLDEPTNNLDIRNIEILTAAIKDYKGTVLAISHDAYFLSQIDISTEIAL